MCIKIECFIGTGSETNLLLKNLPFFRGIYGRPVLEQVRVQTLWPAQTLSLLQEGQLAFTRCGTRGWTAGQFLVEACERRKAQREVKHEAQVPYLGRALQVTNSGETAQIASFRNRSVSTAQRVRDLNRLCA